MCGGGEGWWRGGCAWWEGCAWWGGACIAGGMHGRGVCMARGMHGRGACIVWQILRDTANERAVRIILECILVSSVVFLRIQT